MKSVYICEPDVILIGDNFKKFVKPYFTYYTSYEYIV